MQNSQRVALVTGGATRLGRAMSLALAGAGYDLVIGYRSSGDEAQEVERLIENMARSCTLVQADLETAQGADRLVSAAQTVGRLDVLVNSAATFRAMSLADVDADEWDSVMNVNLRAAHLMVRGAADMLRATRGCVVNITDLSAFQAWAEYPHHSVSKAALAHLTRVQAKSYAPEIRVNGIAPGAVLAPDDWSEERWNQIAERASLQRTGSPDDVVGALLYLIEAEFVTGHIIPVDGGRLI